MTDRKPDDTGDTVGEEVTEELLTDPDSPDKGNASPPPQTTDAEPRRPA